MSGPLCSQFPALMKAKEKDCGIKEWVNRGAR